MRRRTYREIVKRYFTQLKKESEQIDYGRCFSIRVTSITYEIVHNRFVQVSLQNLYYFSACSGISIFTFVFSFLVDTVGVK